MPHTYTCEKILHITCGSCGNWWSYATMHMDYEPGRQLSCPHCGIRAHAVERTDRQVEIVDGTIEDWSDDREG